MKEMYMKISYWDYLLAPQLAAFFPSYSVVSIEVYMQIFHRLLYYNFFLQLTFEEYGLLSPKSFEGLEN